MIRHHKGRGLTATGLGLGLWRKSSSPSCCGRVGQLCVGWLPDLGGPERPATGIPGLITCKPMTFSG